MHRTLTRNRMIYMGHPLKSVPFGSNTIYFGDEVTLEGGNDYPVTRIPGLMIFAVNPVRNLVPFISRIFVPSDIYAGPDATAQVLTQYNGCAQQLIGECREGKPFRLTAIEALKYHIFTKRIDDKLVHLKQTHSVSLDDWQTLHTFVTLMSRNDPAARSWLSLLANELDGIMTQIRATSSTAAVAGQGTSHPD